MSYTEKLKDPRWQKRRLEILERDGWECVQCGCSTQNLQVHHNWYLKNKEPWEYSKSQMCTLCEKCHEDATKTQQEIKESLSAMGPSEQKAFLHRISCRVTSEHECLGVEVSACSDTEGRHERLEKLLLTLQSTCVEALRCVVAVHDHKGLLEVCWAGGAESNANFRHAVEQAWASVGEYCVEHQSVNRTGRADRWCGSIGAADEIIF